MIASTLITTVLARAFYVRGTLRFIAAHPWTTTQYGSNYTAVEVPDLSSSTFSAALARRSRQRHNLHRPPRQQSPLNPDPNAFIPRKSTPPSTSSRLRKRRTSLAGISRAGGIRLAAPQLSTTPSEHHTRNTPRAGTRTRWKKPGPRPGLRAQ
jgi:hypothetical protein